MHDARITGSSTAAPVTATVTAATAAGFARDGVARVRGVLDPDQVAAAARAVEEVLAAPGPLALVASDRDDAGSFTEDFCRWQEIPEIEALARHSRVPEIAAALMATPQARFFGRAGHQRLDPRRSRA
jgi:hypothetical protein